MQLVVIKNQMMLFMMAGDHLSTIRQGSYIFFCLRLLAIIWKYFMLTSPFLIHVSLDLCRAMERSIVARPRRRFLSKLMTSSSSDDNTLLSWANSSREITSRQITAASFPCGIKDQAQTTRAFAVRVNFM
jgi:hypothetical protein